MTSLTYQSTVLSGTGKSGKLKADPDGYYDMIGGGFNTHNSYKAFYDWPSAKRVLEGSSHFQRRISTSTLYAEDGHPVFVPGMTKQQWATRIYTLDHDRRCLHIKEFHIDDTTFKNDDGTPIITVMLRVKPSGARADVAAQSIENEHENPALSIRSITNDYVDPRTNTIVKMMKEIITYDLVIEPGIKHATKYNAPSLEELGIGSDFNRKDILEAIEYVKSIPGSFEDSDSIVCGLNNLLISQESDAGLYLPQTKLILPTAKVPKSNDWLI